MRASCALSLAHLHVHVQVIRELSPRSHDMIIGCGERLAAGSCARVRVRVCVRACVRACLCLLACLLGKTIHTHIHTFPPLSLSLSIYLSVYVSLCPRSPAGVVAGVLREHGIPGIAVNLSNLWPDGLDTSRVGVCVGGWVCALMWMIAKRP
jgi:hypothetical protein